MTHNLKKKTEGFTIIEVLIVLVIAGLIMLIVFLAVPALQRNSRNNARKNDASRLLSAAVEWKNNNGNRMPRTTQVDAADGNAINTQAGTLSYYTSLNSVVAGSTINLADTNVINFLGDNVFIFVNARCQSATSLVAGSGMVAVHSIENGSSRALLCLDS